MICPEVELVLVEISAELPAQVTAGVVVGQPRCEGGGEQRHGRGGGEDGAASHPGTQVAVVVHIGVN